MSKFGVNFTVSNASLEEALSGIGVDHPYSNFAGGFLEVEAESVDQAREIVAKLVFEATGVAPDLGETFCTSELTCPDCGQIVSVLRHQTQRRTMKIPVLAGPQVDEGYRGRYGQHYVLKGSESEWQESGIACSCGCPESPFVAEISVLVEGKDWEEVDERVEISVRLR